ncbi:LacI family DNA-binding transcriptional regulator [Pandoraea sp.]|uniref:LacI family DNA-binding transcriptional regulator n=1 Tax=Pandoraea sp. TaxID=1883445 RepID=UPI0035AF3C04
MPNLADIARLAGVSTATVDRVLHRREGVRQTTAQRVLHAAGELQYLPEPALEAVRATPPTQVLFVLPDRSSKFLRMLGEWVQCSQNQWAPYNVNCRVQFIQGFDPDVLSAALLRRGRGCNGVAFMPLEHPKVREAVNTLADEGVAAVTLISDLSHSRRIAYVGLDNGSAGRTAAYLIARFVGAKRHTKVALIAGSLSYKAHVEREAGFLQLFAEQYPHMQVVGLREGYDDEAVNYRQTRALLEQHPDLAAIYNIGGGSEGVGQALREAGKQHRIVFIGHGLTPDTRALLIDGSMDAVITQSPQSAIMNCVRIFANLREKRELTAGIEANRSQVIFRENLP